MNPTRYFLDTCIFLASAYGSSIEDCGKECNALFDLDNVLLHTSESVCSELRTVSRRRKRLYNDMIKIL
jgi:hypothetical protein